MKNQEELFVERINQKQRAAYHELFREFYPALVGYAMKYLGEQEEAEDVVQDLFVAVWEKEEKFVSYHSFRVFLYHAVRNTCLNKIKHKSVEMKYAAYNRECGEQVEDAESEMMEEEIYRRLFRTIDKLPSRCREIFLLHLDGKKNEEIAAQLHIAIYTVKTQKKRALHYLREHLGNQSILFFLFLKIVE